MQVCWSCFYLYSFFQGVRNEEKNDASDNGDDSSVNNQRDEEMKHDFDWNSLDNVIESGLSKENSENEKSVEPESK